MTDLIDRWLAVRNDAGLFTFSAAAARLGVNTHELERAVLKAREAGDARIPDNLRDSHAAAYDQISLAPLLDQKIHHTVQDRRNAVMYVTGQARDVDDCRRLLDALGLAPIEGRP